MNKDDPSAQSDREEDESDHTQIEIANSVRKWGRATCYLGLALQDKRSSVCHGPNGSYPVVPEKSRFWKLRQK
jgi:hypothetical protein